MATKLGRSPGPGTPDEITSAVEAVDRSVIRNGQVHIYIYTSAHTYKHTTEQTSLSRSSRPQTIRFHLVELFFVPTHRRCRCVRKNNTVLCEHTHTHQTAIAVCNRKTNEQYSACAIIWS